MTSKDPAQFLRTSVQKGYFMLSRAVLDNALEKYRPDQAKPILVGGQSQLKPALRLMTAFRLVIRDVTEGGVTTSYTRWLDSVQCASSRIRRST